MRYLIEAYANHFGVAQLLTELGEALSTTARVYPFDKPKQQELSDALLAAGSACYQARNDLDEKQKVRV